MLLGESARKTIFNPLRSLCRDRPLLLQLSLECIFFFSRYNAPATSQNDIDSKFVVVSLLVVVHISIVANDVAVALFSSLVVDDFSAVTGIVVDVNAVSYSCLFRARLRK